MALKIEKSTSMGFCFGVKRTIDMLEKIAREDGPVEAFGDIVHNEQVLQRLAGMGITVANSLDDIKGNRVAIGAHGVSPALEAEIRSRFKNVINTTCPFVHRAQIAARRLARADFFVVVYGEATHAEVKGILGWADGKGIATLDENFATVEQLPRRIGVLSQTTQIPAHFAAFVKKLIDSALVKDAEIRIIDTICHDIRDRQLAALELAERVDLLLVIGSRTSANTNHLAKLCSASVETHLVEKAEDIQPSWLEGRHQVGVTAGASTSEETINAVLERLAKIQ